MAFVAGGWRLSVRAVKPAGWAFIGAKRRGLTEEADGSGAGFSQEGHLHLERTDRSNSVASKFPRSSDAPFLNTLPLLATECRCDFSFVDRIHVRLAAELASDDGRNHTKIDPEGTEMRLNRGDRIAGVDGLTPNLFAARNDRWASL